MPPEAATFDGPRGPHPLRRALAQNIGLVLAGSIFTACVIAYLAVFIVQERRLPGAFEITSTLDSAMPLIFAAAGQSLVILTKGIDLSVGGVVDLTNAMAAVLMGKTLGSALFWSVVILAVGGLCGLVNGLFVAVGRLPPIVVTLATLSIFQGLAIFVLPEPGGAIPASYSALLVNGDMPWSFLYVIALGIGWYGFRRSRWGVNLFAIGNDEGASRGLGIDVLRTKLVAYVLDGALAAAAGLFLAANATAGDATSGNSYTLTSIVAVVLGGVSLFGGRGSMIGAVIGGLITTMIVNILFFGHVNPLYHSFYEGLFLVVAVIAGGFLGQVIGGGR